MPTLAESPKFEIPTVPVRKFSVAEYHRMIAAGVLTENDAVELLEGWIVPKMPRNPSHDSTVQMIDDLLRPRRKALAALLRSPALSTTPASAAGRTPQSPLRPAQRSSMRWPAAGCSRAQATRPCITGTPPARRSMRVTASLSRQSRRRASRHLRACAKSPVRRPRAAAAGAGAHRP